MIYLNSAGPPASIPDKRYSVKPIRGMEKTVNLLHFFVF